MRIISILENHSQYESQQSNQSEIMVLGIHNFLNYFLSLTNSNTFLIFLQGNLDHLIDQIIWNQFYSSSFLKDSHRFLSFQGNSQYTFLKINGKTFRLVDSLHFTKAAQFKPLLKKCRSLTIEGYLRDGTVKKIDVEMGQHSFGNFDLKFDFQPKIVNLNQNNCNKKSISKTKSKKINSQNKKICSDHKQNNAKTENNSKNNLTQKKKNSKSFKQNNFMMKSVEETLFKQQNVLKERNSLYKTTNPFTNSTWNSKQKRQDIVAALLMQKSQKLNSMKAQVSEKDQEYTKKIENLISDHNEQITRIKEEVKEVLDKYKTKNKDLKKQNKCLSDVSEQLTFSLTNKTAENLDLHKLVQQLTSKLDDKTRYCQQLQNQVFVSEKSKQSLEQQINQIKQSITENREKEENKYLQIKNKYEGLVMRVKKMGLQMSNMAFQEPHF